MRLPEPTPLRIQVRRQRDALAIALRADDRLVALIAAARLRRTIERIQREQPDADRGEALVIESAQSLLAATPPRLDDASELRRLCGWVEHESSDLYELRAMGCDLRESSWSRLLVHQSCVAAADLGGATFDNAALSHCDLTRANLARTSWQHAHAVRCTFTGSVIVDAALDGAVFEDCDLSGTDLAVSSVERSLVAVQATFLRCDLRATRWTGRQLDRCRFLDCKLFGMHGRAEVERVEITNADLSPGGDGSAMGSPDDVLQCWLS